MVLGEGKILADESRPVLPLKYLLFRKTPEIIPVYFLEAILVLVIKQGFEILGEDFFLAFITEDSQEGFVAEGAVTGKVHSENRFGGGVQNQLQLFLALPDVFLRGNPFRDVPGNAHQALNGPVLSHQELDHVLDDHFRSVLPQMVDVDGHSLILL